MRIFSHLHARLDVMGSHAALRQLQLQTFIAHCIVAADDAFLLDAQCLAQELGIDGHEGLLGDRGRLAKAGIVPRQIDLADPSVRRLDVTQTGMLELFDSRSCKVPNIRSLRPRASGE